MLDHHYLKIHYMTKIDRCSDSHYILIFLRILCYYFLVHTTMQFDLGCQARLHLQNTEKKRRAF
jgi:hypothetical protein